MIKPLIKNIRRPQGHAKQCLYACLCLLTGILLFMAGQKAYAYCPPWCYKEIVTQASNTAQTYIENAFTQLQSDVETALDKAFEEYLNFEGSADGSFLVFFEDDLYEGRIVPAITNFTKQMSSTGMAQMPILGRYFDARQQLKTQRLYQELQVQAHRDYQPSLDFCTFGTNVRSLANADAVSDQTKTALSIRQMKRHLGSGDEASSASNRLDKLARWEQLTNTYCDMHDNGWNSTEEDQTGLARFCNTSGASDEDLIRQNIDIDYTRLIDNSRTLDMRLTDETVQNAEQDVMALGNNLFGHNVITRDFGEQDLLNKADQRKYFLLRSIAAKRNVAENSFNSIVALKTAGSETANVNTANFLGTALKELGISDDEIYEIIGENPSYYAQLEILAKKLYQNPDFFAGLYDKPANVLRKSVAMHAIELMLDREIYESQTRKEMTMSTLLSAELNNNIMNTKGQLITGDE